MKRMFDMALACLLFPVLIPLWGLLALLIKLDSDGPVVFRQIRVGQGGRAFTLYKLRSMIHGAENLTGPVWATDPDPRETRIGRLLRRYGLDETLQVINILRGEMSFVGPRPERPFFVERFKHEIPGYERRTLVKPGLTGWAQFLMKHRYDAAIEDVSTKLTFDLEYIRRWSCWFDIEILIGTAVVILRRRKPSIRRLDEWSRWPGKGLRRSSGRSIKIG